MNKYDFNQVKLFKGCSKGLLDCLNQLEIKEYNKKTVLFNQGQPCHEIGIVLEGSIVLNAIQETGEEVTITQIKKNHCFGEVIALMKDNSYLHEVVALSDSKIVLIPNNLFKKYLMCDEIFFSNYMDIISNKVITLNQRVNILSQRTLREKIMMFLTIESKYHNSKTIKMPFNREQLANYLGVLRPSLSRELALMKEDNIIDYDKNNIYLKW